VLFIVSGTYVVSWDIVSSSAYNALMFFDSHMEYLRTYQKNLTRINFVNSVTSPNISLIPSLLSLVMLIHRLPQNMGQLPGVKPQSKEQPAVPVEMHRKPISR